MVSIYESMQIVVCRKAVNESNGDVSPTTFGPSPQPSLNGWHFANGLVMNKQRPIILSREVNQSRVMSDSK
jgi:hypothetical protein